MNKRSFKHIVAGLAAVALAGCIALCGCSSGSSNSSIVRDSNAGSANKIPLTFFGFKADAINLTAIDGAIQGFMDANGNIDISYESIKGEDYEKALAKRDEAGELDDIFMLHHDNIVSMGEAGKLADLSDIPGIENFTDEVKGQFTNPDGSIYFLPTSNSTYNLYINTDLLEQYNQPIPTNWDEFKQVCDYFVSQDIVPIIANNRNSLPTLIQAFGLFDLYQLPEDQLNARLAEFNENPALYAELLNDGVQRVSEMIDAGWFDTAEALDTSQTSDDLAIFAEGTRPFMISGGWASARVMAKDPSFEYGVYPYPILADGSILPIQVDTCISINADSPNLEEAKAFVAYLIQPDVMWEYCDNQASYTPLKDDRIPSEATLAPSVEYLTNGRTVLRAEYRLTLPTEQAATAAAKALLNGKSAQEAEAALAEALQAQAAQ